MINYDFQSPYPEEITLTLRPGMGWAVYTDQGPRGICGQSMNITCPHAQIVFWPDEDSMMRDIKKVGRGGSRVNLQFGVIGSHGVCNLILGDGLEEVTTTEET